MEPTIVTNGTVLPPGALECLRKNGARVKVSLHGPREVHNQLQGQVVYDSVMATIKTLIEARIETSIHTLLYRGSELDLETWVSFLASIGVHKVSFMTYVPRGRGRSFKDVWSFSEAELNKLSQDIDELAIRYRGAIIVRCLDFARKPYIVFETDGSINWQVADEGQDERLFQVAFGSKWQPSLHTDNLVNISRVSEATHILPSEVSHAADNRLL
jgi:sulfatase maturation enzyme AslB (radical SAM superfamily)